MQQLYDAGQQGATDISGNLDNLSSLPWHQDAVNEVRRQVSSKLDEYAKRRDYENLVPDITSLGRWYSNRANELMAPVKQRQDYIKQLDEFNKGKEGELNSYQKQALLSIADEQARSAGSPKDAFGRYNLKYSGIEPDKNIDVNAKVDKLLKEVAIQKGGSEFVSGTDGDWLVKNGVKYEKLAPGTIERIVQDGLSNDQEYQSYRAMQGKIDAHMNTRMIVSPSQLPDQVGGKPNIIKQQALELSAKQGIPFKEALQHIIGTATQNQIDNLAMDYARTKYTTDNRWTTQDYNANPFSLKTYADNTPYMAQGANIQTTNDEQDYGKVQNTIKDLGTRTNDIDKNIRYLQGKLNDPTLAPAVRTQYQAELDNLSNQKTGISAQMGRATQLSDYSKLKTAQKMGYDSYEHFLSTQVPVVEKMMKSSGVLKGGIRDTRGNFISQKDIADALADNRVIFTSQNKTTGDKYQGYNPGDLVTSAQIRTRDGKIFNLPGGNGGDKLANLFMDMATGKDSKVHQFNSLNEKNYKDNVKDYSIQSTSIALPEKDRNELTAFLKNPGTNFTKPGEYGIVPAGDRPANFRVVSINDTRGPNGETRFTVEELDKDNKPTGTYYDALSSNSNISDIKARMLAKQRTPEAQQASEIMRSGSGAQVLDKLTPGNKISLGTFTVNGKEVNVGITVQRTEGGVTYHLVDENGKTIRSTSNTAEAGRWIDRSKQ